MKKKIRVLIVDDSSLIRTLLSQILNSDPDIEVVGSAQDPYVAREKLVTLKPDVMTLDVEMPRMDGITFLHTVMRHFPTRTIIISNLSVANSDCYFSALSAGAIDVMAKPLNDGKDAFARMSQELISRVKSVASAQLQPATQNEVKAAESAKAKSPLVMGLTSKPSLPILAIASSTGGTEALKVLLKNMPRDLPGTVIVQHMPPVFTKSYTAALNALFPFDVKEAEAGDRVVPGLVLLAPGNFHMELMKSGGGYIVKLNQDPLLHGVRPAADILMNSIAKQVGAKAIGVILTGMGRDGAAGLLAMKQAGSTTFAQDEASCVVFGMPKAALDAGAVSRTVKLEDMAMAILKASGSKAA